MKSVCKQKWVLLLCVTLSSTPITRLCFHHCFVLRYVAISVAMFAMMLLKRGSDSTDYSSNHQGWGCSHISHHICFYKKQKKKIYWCAAQLVIICSKQDQTGFFLKGETYMSVLKYVQNNTTKSYFYHSSFMCMPQFLQADQKHFWQETVTLWPLFAAKLQFMTSTSSLYIPHCVGPRCD